MSALTDPLNGGGFAMTNWERIKHALEAARFDSGETEL